MKSQPFSISPTGEKFALPSPGQYQTELAKLKKLADRQRQDGREIVVVVGVGFVGAVVAAVIADATDAKGQPSKFVMGGQRPTTRGVRTTTSCNGAPSRVNAEDPPLR